MADNEKQYLVIDEKGTGHLPVRDSADGPLNHHLLGAAWAALHDGYRGNKYEGPDKAAAITKLNGLYKSEGMEPPAETDSELGIVNSELKAKAEQPPFTIHHSPFFEPRFVATFAEVPGSGLVRIPVAITGRWVRGDQQFTIALEDLNEVCENFGRKLNGEVNVDYEHASEMPGLAAGGPIPSAGRIVKLDEPAPFKKSGDRGIGRSDERGKHSPDRPISGSSDQYILWGWYEPTGRARQLIKNREYRYISPAINWGAKDKTTGKTQGTTITSVALTNRPFLEELPEIHLCELQDSGFRIQDPGSKTGRFVSLQQLHVAGPVNQVSVAYEQAKTGSADGSKDSGPESRILNPESLSAKETTMAKSLKLKCFTDGENKGMIGVFDGDEMIGLADLPEGFGPKDGSGEGNVKESDGKKLTELFASEIGVPGRSLVEIAALVKRGTETPANDFALLSEAIRDGHLNLMEAGRLADAGRVKFSTILQAQEAERKVDSSVKAGKVLPKNRTQALRVALSDAEAFTALVEEARPVVDLNTYGHARGGEATTAQQALMAEVNTYAKENRCSVSVALSEVTKQKPDLWKDYSEEIVAAVNGAGEEEE